MRLRINASQMDEKLLALDSLYSYAAALGAEPIITTTETSTPAAFADLVEYCYGNRSTPMGAKRIVTDGHPDPYRLRFVELGNEQYNANYLEQVRAMEARKAGDAKTLHIITRLMRPARAKVSGAVLMIEPVA